MRKVIIILTAFLLILFTTMATAQENTQGEPPVSAQAQATTPAPEKTSTPKESIAPAPPVSKEDKPSLEIEDKYPLMGMGTKITLIMDNVPQNTLLTVIYRPNGAKAIELRKDVAIFPEDNSIIWKPEEPGNTRLIAWVADDKSEDKPNGKTKGRILATKDVATCYPSPPWSGIAVMFIAGFILFGGLAYSLNLALKK